MSTTWILMSSESRQDETDFQIVAVGPKHDLSELAKHFGVRSWTVSGNQSVADGGRIKLVKAPVWGD